MIEQAELTRIETAGTASEAVMGKHARLSRARETVLPLGQVPITIEWQAAPDEDVLVHLLLTLVGEDGLKEIFDEE